MKKNRKGKCWGRITALLVILAMTAVCFELATARNVAVAKEPADVLEEYSSKNDVATELYPEREGKHMPFTGVEFGKNSYNMTFTARYEENESINYEGLRFIVAEAQEVVKGRTVQIYLNVRDNNLYIWARVKNAAQEKGLFYGTGLLKGKKGEDINYALRYDNGKLWLFENDRVVLDGFDLAGDAMEQADTPERYCNVQPMIELTTEGCKEYKYSNVRLWGDGVVYTGKFPQMPEGNGDYGTTTGVKPVRGSSTEYENGKLYNTKVCTDLIQFKRLPFKADDTYAISFDMTVEEADISWKGVRPIIRSDENFQEYYQILFLESGINLLYQNWYTGKSETIAVGSYSRTLGKSDKVQIVTGPDYVSLWINNVMVLQKIPLTHKMDANVGIQYELTKAVIENISFYYTDPVPYVAPEGDPVIPEMTADMYNAAQYMTVKDSNGPVSYQNYQIKSDSIHYYCSNIPIADDGEYVFRADVTQYSEWTEAWRGTRIKFRTGDSGDYYIYFLKDAVQLIGASNPSYPMKVEVGRTYDIAILSNTDTVTVWLDGELIFDKIDLTATGGKTKPSVGIWFEQCDAIVENIKIYGEDIVFTEETFDVQLKNNKWFNTVTVPQMSSDDKNYFKNVTFGSGTNTDILPEYENGILTNKFSDVSAPIVFVDQNGSHNLNGLKNSDTYVWSAKVKVNAFNQSYKNEEGKVVKDVGVGFVYKNTTMPGNGYENYNMFSLLQDRLELACYKDSAKSSNYTDNQFQLKEGQEYQVDMLIGEEWFKVWVDGKLIFTAYDVPSYNVAFRIQMINAEAEVWDMKVYTVEDDTPEILEVKAKEETTKAGNTIKGMKSDELPLIQNLRGQSLAVVLFVVPVVLVLAGVVVGSICVMRGKSGKRKETGADEEKN